MQAYYETETQISNNHQLHIQLPNNIPAGRAKIAVIYETQNIPEQPIKESPPPKNLLDFLGAGKAYSRFSSAEDIDNFIANNREDWET